MEIILPGVVGLVIRTILMRRNVPVLSWEHIFSTRFIIFMLVIYSMLASPFVVFAAVLTSLPEKAAVRSTLEIYTYMTGNNRWVVSGYWRGHLARR